MDDSPSTPPARDHKALELILRDGLDRLEEFALMLAFQGNGSQFEILSITPSPHDAAHTEMNTHRPNTGNGNIIRMHNALQKKMA